MQLVTPEQAKFLKFMAAWAIDHAAIPFGYWAYRRVRSSISMATDELVDRVTGRVNANFNTRLGAHEESDRAMFGQLDTRISRIEGAVCQKAFKVQ